MTFPARPVAVRRGRRPRRRRRGPGRWVGRAIVVLVAFGLGVALGQALQDNPRPGGERTFVRTLRPLPLTPATATITVRRSSTTSGG
jgi:hypothetical protein